MDAEDVGLQVPLLRGTVGTVVALERPVTCVERWKESIRSVVGHTSVTTHPELPGQEHHHPCQSYHSLWAKFKQEGVRMHPVRHTK